MKRVLIKILLIGVGVLSLSCMAYAAVQDFKIGVEYAVMGLGATYNQTGAITAKPQPGIAVWQNIQPQKGGPYNWSGPDALVREYQQAGFNNIQLIISSRSSWASLGITRDRPSADCEAAYVAFVKAAVDRYNMGGSNPMTGLKYTVNGWGIEQEYSPFFQGNGDDYVAVLKLAYAAIKAANPNAKVITAGLLMWDIFQGNPSDTDVQYRIANNPTYGLRKPMSDVLKLLDAYQYFDVVDFHSLGDYSEITATAKWLWGQLLNRDKENANNKEIYVGDAFPMSPLRSYGSFHKDASGNIISNDEDCTITNPLLGAALDFYPVDATTRCKAAALIAALRHTDNPQYADAHLWLEKNTAIGAVRKVVVAASKVVLVFSGININLNLSGINIGNEEDWIVPYGSGTSNYFGMADTTQTLVRKLDTSKPLPYRPAFDALRLVIEKLDGFVNAERIDMGNNYIYVYKFTKSDGSNLVVAWYDDAKFYSVGEFPPEVNISIPGYSRVGNVTITRTPTVRGETLSEVSLSHSGGRVLLDNLGAAPVFITDASSGDQPAPVLNPIGNQVVSEGALLTFNISASGSGVSYSASNLPTGASLNGQAFSWTPTYQQAGNYSVTFIASNGILSDSQTITITVNNVNRPPVLNSIGNKTVNEGQQLAISLSAADPDGDALVYSATGLPTGANLNAGVFNWTPSYSQAGSYPITFTVSDGSLSASETITITVNDVPQLPNKPLNLQLTQPKLLFWNLLQCKLTWVDNSTNESGFKVYRSTNGVTFSLIKTLAVNTTTYTDTGLTKGVTYYYKVSAYNNVGEAGSSVISLPIK